MIGEDSIRSFDEKNKRARLCKRFYDYARDSTLIKTAWTFANCYKKLQKLDIDTDETVENMSAYQLPNDCLKPIDIAPYGTRQKWYNYGTKLFTAQTPVWLHYTKQVTTTGEFTLPFISILSAKLAVLLAPPITKNNKIVKEMRNAYLLAEQENLPIDANIGSNHKNADDQAMLDTFVTPSSPTSTADSRWLSTD
jgi:hypothetical protein